MSKNEIRFFTPHFENDDIESLIEYISSKLPHKEVVQINLDNCVIQRMEHLDENSGIDDIKNQGLYSLYRLINACPNILVTPLGITEMPGCHVSKAQEAYNRFCRKFWVSHTDDPQATHKQGNIDEKKLIFKDLPEPKQKFIGNFYLAFLLIQLIYKSDSDKTDIQKFEKYLYGIIHYLDMISGFELEIAKYAFWDLKEKEIQSLPDEIRERRKRIRKNFCVEKDSLDKIREFCMNAAMDTFWIRCIGFGTEFKEQLPNGYIVSEHWLATNDEKLFFIANDIKPIHSDQGYGYTVEINRERELYNFSYWNEVEILCSRVSEFRKNNTSQHREKIGNIVESIQQIESEISKYI